MRKMMENSTLQSLNVDDLSIEPISVGNGNNRSAESPNWKQPSRNRLSVACSKTLDPNAKGCKKSFLLVNDQEILQISSAEEFTQKLNCPPTAFVKTVSIFGNTGEGKSHTMNHTFFGGREVFSTSTMQESCTLGVWAAYDSKLECVLIDTEGLLGASHNPNQRTRLLLKVLAISDVVVYRTRAERLHNDLFQFMGDASRAYMAHFTPELNAASERCGITGSLSSLGPVVIVFHETQHTQTLQQIDRVSPEDQIKQRFVALGYNFEAFSAINYVGTQTQAPPTNFSLLQQTIKSYIKNNSVRSSRQPSVIFHALKVLNEKFYGDIERVLPSTFPDQYFTCKVTCQSCGIRCCKSVNHSKDGVEHTATSRCRYQHQFDNKIFTCRMCFEQGREVVVHPKTSSTGDSVWMGIAKYAWSGYVLECPHCGITYRSRQYWYGNRDPVDSVVRTEIRHVWPGIDSLPNSQNTARLVLDSVNYLSNTICTVSAGPAKMISSWVADRIAPDYWVPNADITHCGLCKTPFGSTDHKHHCRACGEGFCENCCNNFRPVPERGWGPSPVRVCNKCFKNETPATTSTPNSVEVPEVTARKVGEALHSTLGTVFSTIEYPLGFIKESARPSYWIPDEDVLSCAVCHEAFSPRATKHHCRACGQGVCDGCSPHTRCVPSRGWERPVRVCKCCVEKGEL